MNDVASGWYPDPEDAAQVRYWDGTMWTDHRAPAPASTSTDVRTGDPMAVVTGAFKLVTGNWVQLLAIAGLGVSLFAAGAVLVIVGFSMSLDPGLWEIIDTTTAAGFNPDIDPVDRAFVDSIRWEWNAGFLFILLGGLVGNAGSYGGMAAGAIHLVSVRAGAPRNAASSFASMLRQLPRWFGILLLWSLGFAGCVALVVLLYVAAGFVTDALLLLLIPATIGLIIAVWPVMQLSPIGLVLAPRGTPPLRHVLGLVQTNWGGIAVRCLLLNIFAALANIALQITGVVPLVGLVLAIPGMFLIYSYQIAGGVLLYEYAEGDVDPAIPDPSTPAAGAA